MTEPRRIYPSGFDIGAHLRWVLAGHCDALDYKTWCSGEHGHEGPHWAPHLTPDGQERRMEWR